MEIAVKELVDELLEGNLTEVELVEKLQEMAELDLAESAEPASEPASAVTMDEINRAAKKARLL